MSSITHDRLKTVLLLEEPFILKELAERLRSKDVSNFWTAVAFITRLVPEVKTDDLTLSIRSLHPGTDLDKWLQRWVRKATRFPGSPDGLNDSFIVLHSANAISDAAVRFRNCLKDTDKISAVALGRMAYLEYRPVPAIVELIALSEGRWACLDGIYGPKNARLDPGTKRLIRRKLQASGVLVYARHTEASRWNSVARLLGVYDHDDPILEGGFELTQLEGTS